MINKDKLFLIKYLGEWKTLTHCKGPHAWGTWCLALVHSKTFAEWTQTQYWHWVWICIFLVNSPLPCGSLRTCLTQLMYPQNLFSVTKPYEQPTDRNGLRVPWPFLTPEKNRSSSSGSWTQCAVWPFLHTPRPAEKAIKHGSLCSS